MAYPTFEAPSREESRKRMPSWMQKFAAPQVGRLKRAMQPGMITGGDPWAQESGRGRIRGYGEGLGSILGTAGQLAGAREEREYGTEFRAAELGFGAEMEEERGRLGREEAERVRGWRTGERTGAEEAVAEEALLGREWRGREAEEEREWQAGETTFQLTGERRRPGSSRSSVGPGTRAQGGPVTKKPYLVGEEGPELFVPATSGTIIPNPKTQKKMSPFISRRYGGWVAGKENERLRKEVQRAQYRLQLKDIRSTGRGKGTQATSPFSEEIMRYLKSTRMDPSGAGHMPTWQFMLIRQPDKLAGLMSLMSGKKVSFGKALGAPSGRGRASTPQRQRPSMQIGAGGFEASSPRSAPARGTSYAETTPSPAPIRRPRITI